MLLYEKQFRVTMASWSNMGGWKENAHVASMPRVCQTFRTVLKSIWFPYLKAIYGEVLDCPFMPVSRFLQNTIKIIKIVSLHTITFEFPVSVHSQINEFDCVRS